MILDKLLSHRTQIQLNVHPLVEYLLGFLIFLFSFLNLKLIEIYFHLYGFCCFVIVVSWGFWFNYVLKQIGFNLYVGNWIFLCEVFLNIYIYIYIFFFLVVSVCFKLWLLGLFFERLVIRKFLSPFSLLLQVSFISHY